jgi:hypothetical protein
MVPYYRVQGPRRETGEMSGTSETWGLFYLVCLVCLVGRIGKPIRGTRETS